MLLNVTCMYCAEVFIPCPPELGTGTGYRTGQSADAERFFVKDMQVQYGTTGWG